MKRKLEDKKIISAIIVAIIIFITKVYATNDSFFTTLQTNSIEVKRENDITITIGLKDIAIESGEKGIGAYTAGIKFDSSVLEYVSTNGTSKWEAPFYQDGLIVGNTKDGEVVNTTQSIGTITFRVKKDASLGKTAIELINFVGSTVGNDVPTKDQSIELIILDDNNNDNSNDDSNNNNNNDSNNDNSNNNNIYNGEENNSNNSNSNQITSTNNKKDNTVNTGKLPQTGGNNIVLLSCISLAMVFSVILYRRMKS